MVALKTPGVIRCWSSKCPPGYVDRPLRRRLPLRVETADVARLTPYQVGVIEEMGAPPDTEVTVLHAGRMPQYQADPRAELCTQWAHGVVVAKRTEGVEETLVNRSRREGEGGKVSNGCADAANIKFAVIAPWVQQKRRVDETCVKGDGAEVRLSPWEDFVG